MPTYEYECNACGHNFEVFQSFSEAVKRKCPECGKRKLERLIGGGAAIVFKGSGFYQTDYRSAEYQKSAEKDRKAAESAKSDSSKDSSSGGDAKKSSGDSSKSGGDAKKSGDGGDKKSDG
ncbi:MAG: zinc ribbon domain-containing protein [Pirellulaceae bacterium]|jgi:putative FmdB family regulatory protein|nr:zinc ribbon domain-containing protein [Pirellulaceae bacterium]